ncbi:olfactory receptor 14J1-like [Strigops habroptila]|uniref:olfactory receptor 14J1-like n=1 Tax=Strigops habroptila TaxID=2489341 RepID=UPI0011CF4528|nr:olfactory receptor 14J1-like [Strigops habroptila]
MYNFPIARKGSPNPRCNRGSPATADLDDENFLHTVMSCDRYVAICKPLHYGTLLGSRACVHMAAAAWGTGFLYALLHTANTFSLPLCLGNAVEQFFCEIPQILKLSCSHSYLREVGRLVVGACLALGCFVFIVGSYVQIFRAVLRIPSEQGRHKAFSTCLPHLAVVSLFTSTAAFASLRPPSSSSPSLNLVVSVPYSVVPPARKGTEEEQPVRDLPEPAGQRLVPLRRLPEHPWVPSGHGHDAAAITKPWRSLWRRPL